MHHVVSSISRTDLDSSSLTVDLTVCLKPWFSRSILTKALEHILSGEVAHHLFHRDMAGVVFRDGSLALTRMPASSKKSQGFIFRDGWCSRCSPGKPGKSHRLCNHVAVTALFALKCAGGNQLMPQPLFFAETSWPKIGAYLHGISEGGNITAAFEPAGEHTSRLRLLGPDGLELELAMSREAASELALLHKGAIENAPKPANEPDTGSALTTLHNTMIALCRTGTEQQLAARNSFTRKEREETSVWMSLARLLSSQLTRQCLAVARNKAGNFVLTATLPEDQEPLLRLTLPKSRCVELLTELEVQGVPVAKLASSAPFFSVMFDGDKRDAVVDYKLRLDDGRIFSTQELAANQYGNHYYLQDEGFVGLRGMRPEEMIHPLTDPATAALPLFAAARAKTARSFIVPSEQIPFFVEKNKKALQSVRHEVDTTLLSMQLVEMPDRLQLTFYEEKEDWCYLAGFYDLGNQSIDISDILAHATQKRQYAGGNTWLDVDSSPLSWFHQLGPDRVCPGEEGEPDRIRLRPHELLALANQVPELGLDKRKKKMAKALEALLNPDNPALLDKIVLLAEHLRDYQRHGVLWLDYLSSHGLGGILADDMGLGKTHQALAFMDLQATEQPDARFLVVCPASVALNWVDKAEKFFPNLTTAVYHGGNRDLDHAGQARVMVTTYGVMRNDINALTKIEFRAVLFDEMQQLKNVKTELHRAASRLTRRSLIGLTGTPIENSLEELRALLDLCLPGMFAANEFRKRFIDQDSPETRQQLSRLTGPFLLRRTRGQVLDELPDVIDDIRTCELHPDQVGMYRQIIDENQSLVEELEQGERPDTMNVLAVITRLKQICNHPCLLEGERDWNLYGSGKWELWRELIDECLDAGLKVVVFSQFTSMLDIMTDYLKSLSVDFCALRGDMSPQKRQQAINRFADDDSCRICLASLLAGGVGIDLTAARVVIHYDRWWNPAKEEQATARVHRMGQRHVVQVIKLINSGTLEEKIHTLIEKKRAMADEVIIADDASIMKRLNREDLAELLRFGG